MERLIKSLMEEMKKPSYRRYENVHRAIGAMIAIKDEHGDEKLYSAADVLALLETVALDTERINEKEAALEVRVPEQPITVVLNLDGRKLSEFIHGRLSTHDTSPTTQE